MQYKLVICDMDGTLLTSNHTISEYSKNIISKLNEKGIIFVIATGRPYLDAKFFKNQLGLKSFLVTSNGAVVHNENDEEIISEKISEKYVNKILDFEVDKKEYHRNIYKNGNWYIEYKIEGLDEFHAESGFPYKIENFDRFKNHDITKFFYLAKENKIEVLEHRLREEFSEDLTITLSSSFCIELLKKGTNKGNTIKKIATYLNIPLENIVAFGDGLNDYEMLSIVGRGFIMDNANPRLKEKLPELEIIGNCNEDGVAKKLEKIFLQN